MLDDSFPYSSCYVAARKALGEMDAALQQLRAFEKNKWRIGLGELILFRHRHPYDPSRNEPGFVALLEGYDKNEAEQRCLPQAMSLPVKQVSRILE